VTAVRTLVVYAEGVRSFSVIEQALRAHYAQPLLRELLWARKVCQRCLAASFCLTS